MIRNLLLFRFRQLPVLGLTPNQIAWLAGLLEGEGTFTPVRCRRLYKRRRCYGLHSQPRVQFQSQDKDIVSRVAKLVGVKTLGPYSQKRTNKPTFSTTEYKPCWVTSVAGRKAAAIIMLIYPLMGSRRKRQMRNALKEWGVVYDKTNSCEPSKNTRQQVA